LDVHPRLPSLYGRADAPPPPISSTISAGPPLGSPRLRLPDFFELLALGLAMKERYDNFTRRNAIS
jgi:hypothetical protein